MCAAPLSLAVETAITFDDLDLPPELSRAVDDLGFDIPTAIQAAAIPALLDGRDITGVAQTGTGKTAAFGLPLLAAIDHQRARRAGARPDPDPRAGRPGRRGDHLVRQRTCRRSPSCRSTAAPASCRSAPRCSAGAQVVVGTPGRIIDHLERGTLDLSGLKFLVLDEADEMLRMGFAEDVDRILTDAPGERQTALFSATMPPAIRSIARKHLTDPVDIAVSRQSSTVDAVRQTYAIVPFRDKVDALTRVLQVSEGDAHHRVRPHQGRLRPGRRRPASPAASPPPRINGDVPQKERERIIDRLRDGRLDVLVATDVAARGLDVDRVDLVVNFDAPGEPESYVHRIGRTGRAGRTGKALTFFTPREIGRLRAIERATRNTLEQITPPTAADVADRGDRVLDERPSTPGSAADPSSALPRAVATFLAEQDLTADELAATLLALAAGDDGTPRVAPPRQPSTIATLRHRPASRAVRRASAAATAAAVAATRSGRATGWPSATPTACGRPASSAPSPPRAG